MAALSMALNCSLSIGATMKPLMSIVESYHADLIDREQLRHGLLTAIAGLDGGALEVLANYLAGLEDVWLELNRERREG